MLLLNALSKPRHAATDCSRLTNKALGRLNIDKGTIRKRGAAGVAVPGGAATLVVPKSGINHNTNEK